MKGKALWLLCKPSILFRGRIYAEEEIGRAVEGRGGEGELEISSALPSRESDSRTFEAGVVMLKSIRSGHEVGWTAFELLNG